MSSFAEDDYLGAFSTIATRPGQTLEGRREAERKKMHKSDRRRVMRTGRTIQFNFKVRDDWKTRFLAKDAARQLMPVTYLEWIDEIVDRMEGQQ